MNKKTKQEGQQQVDITYTRNRPNNKSTNKTIKTKYILGKTTVYLNNSQHICVF